jgi:D-alanine-D-alanine ligase
MENIAIFYGGKSVEHEVSIITALQVIENIDKEKYKVFPVYIAKNGEWWQLKDYLNKKAYLTLEKQKKMPISFKMGHSVFYSGSHFKKKIIIDAAINCCHGTYGEDGVLQGVFESLNMPYSSADVTSSGVCMNKIVMKQLFEYLGLPITNWLYFEKAQAINFEEIEKTLSYPIFVKPANLGSSVGISKCEEINQLKKAIEIAFSFDRFIILEQGVENLKEINCSVQKINKQICTSELEVPINWENFLTYEKKYISKSKQGNKTVIAPKLNNKLKQDIEDMSKKAYEKFFLDGVIRIDYLYDKKQKQLFINEINTIPGSLSFYLWKGKGLTFKEHITNQILNAKEKAEMKAENLTDFSSKLLKL